MFVMVEIASLLYQDLRQANLLIDNVFEGVRDQRLADRRFRDQVPLRSSALWL